MKTVLITGTTSGLGRALAEKFARQGYHLVMVSLDGQKLERQKEELLKYTNRIDILALDLREEKSADEVYYYLEANHIDVDILINNAGFNQVGEFSQTDQINEFGMINLHIRFLTELTKLLLPKMQDIGYGKVVNIGSIGSYIASPLDAVYSATKAYVLSFSKAVNYELRKSGVSILAVCPGSMDTDFAKTAGIQDSLLFKIFVMKPEFVARKIIKSLDKKKAVLIPGWYSKLLVFSAGVLPARFVLWLTEKMIKTK